MRRLPTPLLAVTLPDRDDPVEVQATNIDMVMWDRAAARHKWPEPGKAPFLWLTFIAWSAARRAGVVGEDMTYEQFEGTALAIENLTDDDDQEGAVTPTGPDLESGY